MLETVEKDHGRIEIRRHAPSSQMDGLEAKSDGAGLQAVGRVEPTRIIGEKTSADRHYFLCSLVEQDRFAATASKSNSTGVLDVQFGEDACRTRKDCSAENHGPDASHGPQPAEPQ